MKHCIRMQTIIIILDTMVYDHFISKQNGFSVPYMIITCTLRVSQVIPSLVFNFLSQSSQIIMRSGITTGIHSFMKFFPNFEFKVSPH